MGRGRRFGVSFRAAAALACWLTAAAPALAGSGWVAGPGEGYLQTGYSRKTADHSWDADGKTNRNNSLHDFRYSYLSGEVGVHQRASATFLFTYLWGFEGPEGDMEENFGLSDAWVGAKVRVKDGDWPQAVRAAWRTPFLYDQQGPYRRHLYSVRIDHQRPEGRPGAQDTTLQSSRVVQDTTYFVMNNPEWRGLLRNDLALLYAVSHSFQRFPGWMSLEAGYNLRQGSPADDIPVNFELGYSFAVKSYRPYLRLGLNLVKSVGNNSDSETHDRFGTTSSFNDASILRGGLSVLCPVAEGWTVEAGYNQWLWGVGARQYKEPFLAVSRRL